MTMEACDCTVPPALGAVNDSANDAWKRCTLEMASLISKSTGPPLIRDYNNLLLENRDLKKQYKMAIAALDSIITEKNGDKNGCKSLEEKGRNMKDKKTVNIEKKKAAEIWGAAGINVNKNTKIVKESGPLLNLDGSKDEEILPVERNCRRPDLEDCTRTFSFKTIKKKFDPSHQEHPFSSTCPNEDAQKAQEFLCSSCTKVKLGSSLSKKINVMNDGDVSSNRRTVAQDVHSLKRELEQTYEENNNLKKELRGIKGENDELRDQVHSLELSLKTLTEAINLQDEQLSEYGSIVISLKNSRSVIVEKMKDANARNNYNIMIMGNIEQEVGNLRRQLDAYNELLVNQNIQHIDKASCTEQSLTELNKFEEEMKRKDNYITMLQDRLCEAIVDLRNKDTEIKSHADSVKVLISNNEAEKKGLEGRLKFANVSAERLEEHKMKQQETMKQLMKLIEFLQEKLEKVNKK